MFRAAIIATVFGLLAAACSQGAYWENRLGQFPTYFGGQPAIEDVSLDESSLIEGARERSIRRAAAYQSVTTAFVVATPLVSVYAAVLGLETEVAATVGGLIGVVVPFVEVIRWWNDDRELEAKAAYYSFMQRGGKWLRADQQDERFAREFPKQAKILKWR